MNMWCKKLYEEIEKFEMMEMQGMPITDEIAQRIAIYSKACEVMEKKHNWKKHNEKYLGAVYPEPHHVERVEDQEYHNSGYHHHKHDCDIDKHISTIIEDGSPEKMVKLGEVLSEHFTDLCGIHPKMYQMLHDKIKAII